MYLKFDENYIERNKTLSWMPRGSEVMRCVDKIVSSSLVGKRESFPLVPPGFQRERNCLRFKENEIRTYFLHQTEINKKSIIVKG